MKSTKWVFLLVAVGVVAVAVFAAMRWRTGEAVEVVRVEAGPIEESIDERAITRLGRTYLLSMPYAGRIAEIDLREGDSVGKDTPVVRLVAEDLQLAVDEAEAAVARLDAALAETLAKDLEELAQRQAYEFVRSMNDAIRAAQTRVDAGVEKRTYYENRYERIRKAHSAGAITDDERERAYLDLVTSRFDLAQDELVLRITRALSVATELLPEMVQQMIEDKSLSAAVLRQQKAEAEAVLARARLQQRRGTVLSPVDGLVLQRHVIDERFLPAGEPLLEIGALADLEIEADLLSIDAVDVQLGDRVEIYGPAVGPQPAQGRVARIHPAAFTKISSLGVEEQRVKVVVAIEPEDRDRLIGQRQIRVGYRVRVRIVTDRRENVLVVPRSALFRGENDRWQLFLVKQGRARQREVQIGLISDRSAEVVSGLEAGALIVRNPPSSLRDGARVAP